MGAYIYGDLIYASAKTGKPYYRDRAEDTAAMFNNCADIFSRALGREGVSGLTERYCPSDGLLIEKFPDGSPSSLWFAHNAWAMSAVLEGLMQKEYNRYHDTPEKQETRF